MRGIRTFAVRMRQHNANGLAVAKFLETHKAVKKVWYPWLKSHPQFELGKRQMPGGGSGMVTFDLAGGKESGFRLLSSVKLCTLAVSLGGVHTLITHPASTISANLSDEEIAAAVDYMMAAVGGGAATAIAKPAPVPEPEAIAEASPAADNAKGKEAYDAACFICHAPGAAGAPRFGDAAAWATRIEKGIETLYKNSIDGYMGDFGMMPPKGGRPDFSDEDVKAAVNYMVSNAN